MSQGFLDFTRSQFYHVQIFDEMYIDMTIVCSVKRTRRLACLPISFFNLFVTFVYFRSYGMRLICNAIDTLSVTWILFSNAFGCQKCLIPKAAKKIGASMALDSSSNKPGRLYGHHEPEKCPASLMS